MAADLAAIIGEGASALSNIGFGVYDRYKQAQKEKEARKRVKQVTEQTESDYNQMLQMLEKWRGDQTQTASPEMVSEYSRLLENFDPSEYTADIEKFEFTDEQGNKYPQVTEENILEDYGLADIEMISEVFNRALYGSLPVEEETKKAETEA